MTLRQLGHKGLQAHLRALELHHMMVRCDFNLSHLMQKAEQKRDDAEAASELRACAIGLEEENTQLRACAAELEAHAAGLEADNEKLKDQIKGLDNEIIRQADAFLPPTTSSPSPLLASHKLTSPLSEKEVDDQKPAGHALSMVDICLSLPKTSVVLERLFDTHPEKSTFSLGRSSLYNIDLDRLPVSLNLPMVYKPIDWSPIKDRATETLSDLSGGYLSLPIEKLCDVMNKQQCQAFQINRDWLEYLKSNWDEFVEQALLMPSWSSNPMNEEDLSNIKVLAAFHYRKFTTKKEANDWFIEHIDQIMKVMFQYVIEAKHPFQFFKNIIGLAESKMEVLSQIPITQDASSSAYQIMSYFMLDETMAKRTNLIPTSDGKIQDVYNHFLE
ncbi:hypothetical protein KSP39_PZI012556 [Platanthera zijinensis]|uniref:DNA-directed RNA polymerase n=1 Tax=Platanthera zijinensis TaxID=2320716 RepID=A0AAP0BF19_9ASPA